MNTIALLKLKNTKKILKNNLLKINILGKIKKLN
jgi:hypothetical protein